MLKKKWLLWIVFSLCVWGGHVQAWDEGRDRSRSGELLLAHEVLMLEESIGALTTVEVKTLSIAEVSVMGRVFGVPPASIQKFRWGHSLAPEGHLLCQTLWYTIWYDPYPGSRGSGRLTLRVDRNRRVVEEKWW